MKKVYRDKYKATGKCINCGGDKEPNRKNKGRCKKCAIAHSNRQKLWMRMISEC